MPHHGRTPPPPPPLPPEQEFERDFLAHVVNGPALLLTLSGHDAFCLLSTIQFALRHPQFPHRIRRQIQPIVARLQEHLSSTPTLAAIVRAGDDPRYDVPVEGT